MIVEGIEQRLNIMLALKLVFSVYCGLYEFMQRIFKCAPDK